MVNGLHEFSDGTTIEITNGNHVKLHILQGGLNGYINLSNVNQNTISATSVGNINSLPTIFTLPVGTAILYLKNISNIGMTSKMRTTTNMRRALSTTSINFNEDLYLYDNNDVVIEREITSTTNIGCLLYWTGLTIYQGYQPYDVEFDVEFYVNNERWI